MMKKVIKKLLAALLAVAMVCAMAIPAFADNTEGDVDSNHCYAAFQIFDGDVSEGNDNKDFKISNVNWGKNITDPAAFLEQLRNDSTIGTQFQFADATDAADAATVVDVINGWQDSDPNSIAFARFVCHYLYPDAGADSKPVVRAGSNSSPIPMQVII